MAALLYKTKKNKSLRHQIAISKLSHFMTLFLLKIGLFFSLKVKAAIKIQVKHRNAVFLQSCAVMLKTSLTTRTWAEIGADKNSRVSQYIRSTKKPMSIPVKPWLRSRPHSS